MSVQDRYSVKGHHPSSPIRSCLYLYQAGSADQLPFTVPSAGGSVAHEEAGWCYSAEDCEAWAWHSFFCTSYTSPLPSVCLVSGRTVHKRRTVQHPKGPIACRLPTEDMEEPGEESSFKDTQGRYLAFIEWEGCSVAIS